jgi:hypothetical protein
MPKYHPQDPVLEHPWPKLFPSVTEHVTHTHTHTEKAQYRKEQNSALTFM